MQFPIRNRWIRAILWALLAVLLLWAVLWAAVPPLVKSQLPRLLGDQLGRKVDIGAVDFRPWTLELTARDLTVATADGQGIQARVDRIYLNAEMESLLSLAPVVDAVHLDAPRLSITRRADGSLDIDDIRKQLASDPAPAEETSNEPFKFALRDVIVQNGAVDFVDRVTDSKHELQDLDLRVPMLSSLPSARETKVEPRLSFKLDGVAFEATGNSTPYADSRSSNATLTFSGFSIAPYLVYLPAGLPVQPESARLDAQLQIGYVQTPEPALKISGPVTARDVAASNPAGEPLLALDRVRITLADVSPLQQQVAVRSIEIDSPRVALRRLEDGTLALAQPADESKGASSAAAGTDEAATEPGKPWQVSVQQIALKDGQLVWVDRSTQPQAQANLRQLQLQASDIAYPFQQPARFSGSAAIGTQIPQGDAPLTAPLAQAPANGAAGTPVAFEGKATDRSAEVQWKLNPLSFDLAKPYLAQLLVPTLRGTVSAQGGLEWQAAAEPAAGAAAAAAASAPAARIVLRLDQLLLDQIALTDPDASGSDKPLASVAKIEVADAAIDLAQRTAAIGNFRIADPAVHIRRNAEGRWMAQDWLKTGSKADAPAAADAPAQPQDDAAPAWSLKLDRFALEDGDVTYTDAALAEQSVEAALRRLDVQASNVAYPLGPQTEFNGSAQLAAPLGEPPAPLDFSGSTSSEGGQVAIKLDGLPLAAGKPLLAQFLKPTLTGRATLDGAVQWTAAPTGEPEGADDGPRLVVRANRFALEDLALQTGEDAPVRIARIELTDAGADLSSQHVQLGQLQIVDPKLDVARSADGQWMFEDWLKQQKKEESAQPQSERPAAGNGAKKKAEGNVLENAGPNEATSAPAEADADASPADAAKSAGWSFALNDFKLEGGDVSYTDRALAEQVVRAELAKLQLQASNLALPFAEPAAFSGSAQLQTADSSASSPFTFSGKASDTQADVDIKLEGLPFAAARPFYAKFLKPTLSGNATLDGAVQWTAASAGAPPEGADNGMRLVVRASRLALEDVALRTGEEEAPVRVARVELTDAGVDLSGQHVRVGQLEVVDPKLDVARSADGRWMFEDWLKPQKQEDGTRPQSERPAAGNEAKRETEVNAVKTEGADAAADAEVPAADAAKPAGWSFALNDFKLGGGDISYTDRALAEQVVRAELARLQLQASGLALPFAEPAVFSGSAQLQTADGGASSPVTFNGKASDTQADVDIKLEALPFAAARPFYAKFLKPTLSGSATLDGAVQWQAAEGDASSARLTLQANRLTLNDIALAEANRRLAGIDRVTVADTAVDLSKQRVRIGKVEVRAPKADVTRDADGRWMFEDWLRTPAASGAANSGGGKKTTAAAPAWKVDLAQLSVTAGQVDYRDLALAGTPVELDLSKIELQADKLGLPFNQPASFKGSAMLANEATAKSPSKLAFSGSASATQATVEMKADGVPLTLAQPFYASLLEPTLQGRASIDSTLKWQAAKSADGSAEIVVQAKRLALDDLALMQEGNELARVGQVAVNDATLDLAARKLQVSKLQVSEPVATVERNEQGQWMYQRWLKNGGSGAAPAAAQDTATPAAAGADPWAVQLADVALAGGRVAFRDRAQPSPVAFDLSRIQLETQNVTLDGTDPAPLHVSAQIEPPAGEGPGATTREGAAGQLDYRGELTLRPQLQANGKVDATRIPVHLFEPYFASQLNIEIARADASFKGDTGYAQTDAGAKLNLRGDVTVQDVRANAVAAAAPVANSATAGSAGAPDAIDDTQVGDELVNWKTLNLTGLNVAIAPGEAASVSLEQTALTDFFARMILYPDGKLNLQELVKSGGDAGGEAPTETTAAATPAQPAARIDIGTTSFVNGRIHFTDLLIKPNYSAKLSDLTGKLGAFSSRVPVGGQPELARLELRGSTEQSASIEVDGRLNPLAKPLALDIAGKVRDLELPPFSPYSIKYAGHPIERGRLSMDVNYRIRPDGQLTADNNLVLTQLRFGEKVEGAPNSLPVKLATALLADSEGVIDLDLPISGSIDDPQFSIADVLGNAVGNLLGKAVTAPFSLLGRAIGGIADAAGGGDASADALNEVTFKAGSAELTARARSGLDQVAKALAQRDALQVTIAGTAGNPAEREAWKQAQLSREIDRERVSGASAPPPEPAAASGERGAAGASASAGAEEAPKATDGNAGAPTPSAADADTAGAVAAAAPLPSSPLRRLYEQADIPKPRNPDGAAQPLSDNEMERLLLSRIEASDEALRELAVQRGVAVRDYLEGAGLSKSRLFLGEAKLVESGQLAQAPSGAGASAEPRSDRYLPHAELALETR